MDRFYRHSWSTGRRQDTACGEQMLPEGFFACHQIFIFGHWDMDLNYLTFG